LSNQILLTFFVFQNVKELSSSEALAKEDLSSLNQSFFGRIHLR